ncbi:cell envelope biogenesis protein OmpA [Leptospira semungkisensis]|uniref:Cell envelope biogenesis protein OmpA n=1 Tax=Leptospira semungkisensis TaxID=2484985 RepID=A0A4R9G7G1_9LEPT|nr:cell envelope biogenesis protein OmpA [Leptospira semungkisensis]TGK07558.1 cell envelope biogenesis protein OmpA [Leptospira semungkisensis]
MLGKLLPYSLVLGIFLSHSISANSLITTESGTFSPNWDGNSDFMKFKIQTSSLPKLQDWELTIRSASGDAVRKFEAGKLRKKGFTLFSDENEFAPEDIYLPSSLEWNGENETGDLAGDGYYTYQLLLLTANKEKILSEEATFYLDARAPKVEANCKTKLLLVDDRNLAKIFIQQKASGESTDMFVGEFLDSEGRSIKSYSWRTKDLPFQLVWDGTDSNGRMVSPGLYSYRLTGRDSAGNESSDKVENLSVRNESSGIDLNTDGELFPSDPSNSLNHIKFSAFISSKLKSDSYEWEIFKNKPEDENLVYSQKGLGEPSAEWVWEPKNKEAKSLDAGIYYYRLTVFSRYDKYISLPKKFVLSNESPKFSYDVFPNGLTPDGDWQKDILEIHLRSKSLPLSSWKISILESFGDEESREERTVRSWSGQGNGPEKLIWYGLDDQGRRIGSLAPIRVILSYKDIFGGEGDVTLGSVQTDILIVKEKEGFRFSIPNRIYEDRWWTLPSRVKSVLAKFPGYKVELQYHTSHRGDDEYNLRFSEEKARKIFQSLFGKDYEFGRYRFRGYGETLPLIPGNGSYEVDRNERVDFFLSVGK